MGNVGIYSVVEIRCIRYNKIAKQNVSQVSRGKALPTRHSRKLAVTIYHDSSHSDHVLSTCFTLREGYSWATRENFFDCQFALSLHNLSHTQSLQRNPTKNTGYIRLNKIKIKFGMKLKPIQNNYKSQLYKNKEWKFGNKVPIKVNILIFLKYS